MYMYVSFSYYFDASGPLQYMQVQAAQYAYATYIYLYVP